MVVDSGHLFADTRASVPSKRDLKKYRLISRAYKRMGVAAINVGNSELMQGLSFLQQEASRGLPLISANLIDPSRGTPIFSPYAIKKVGNIRVAFFGLLSPDMNLPIQNVTGGKTFIKDPLQTAKDVMETLRGQADVIMLLSDLGLERERELLRKVSGIHIVMGGREGQYLPSPIRDGNTPIFQSYRKGMYAGKLQLTISDISPFSQDEGRTDGNRFRWTLIPLDGSLPEDKIISEWIRKAGFANDMGKQTVY
jgi:5'-nucleotidase/UDP-sugar diphosphatase